MIFGTPFQRTPWEILMKFGDDNLRTFEVICKRNFKMTSANFLVTPVPGTPHVNCRILHWKLFSIWHRESDKQVVLDLCTMKSEVCTPHSVKYIGYRGIFYITWLLLSIIIQHHTTIRFLSRRKSNGYICFRRAACCKKTHIQYNAYYTCRAAFPLFN